MATLIILPATPVSESTIDRAPAVIPVAAAVTLNCPEPGLPELVLAVS